MLSTRTSLGIAGILLASPRALRLLVLTGDGTASPASRSLPVSAAAEPFTVDSCCDCPYTGPVRHPPPPAPVAITPAVLLMFWKSTNGSQKLS